MLKDKLFPLKRHTAYFLLLIAPLLAACNSTAPQTPANAPPVPTPTLEALLPVPTVDDQTPEATAPLPAAYPDTADEANQTNDAYPIPPSPAPTTDPYPGGLIWIIRPVGVQCEADRPAGYGSLNEAVATLNAAGISAQSPETIELAVTTACGSPTSEHYRVQIGADHLPTVEGMGWVEE